MESFLSGRNDVTGGCPPQDQHPAKGFRPFFSPTEPPSAGKSVLANTDAPSEPLVELLSGENGIKRIVITCSCGKRIELECQYD